MKKALIPMMLAALLLSLSSCARKDEPMATTTPTSSPTATTSPMTSPGAMVDEIIPDMTGEPGMGGDDLIPPTASEQPAAQGVTTVSDARKAIEEIEDELERLSEVDDAQVVIAGKNAAVALEFEPEYQGEVDDRLREIVKERIGSVISGVENIAITTDRALMEQLETLGDRLEGAADMADIQNELNAIINKISTSKA